MREVGRERNPSGPADQGGTALPRRHFLGASAGLLGLQAFSGSEAPAETSASHTPAPPPTVLRGALDQLHLADFESLVGETILARTADGSSLELELIEAKASEPRPGLSHMGIREDPFVLRFRAPASTSVSQGCFALEHRRLGTLDLFLCPIGFRRLSDPFVIEAVFA